MLAPRLKVLLVEDNPADARLIQESLADATEEPFDLEVTDTLAAGLQRLATGGIDAMLLDLALPDSFGQDTFLRAKARALGVAIIVLTGLKDDSLALKLSRVARRISLRRSI
jgi:DNA-binding response OmpR family regulator